MPLCAMATVLWPCSSVALGTGAGAAAEALVCVDCLWLPEALNCKGEGKEGCKVEFNISAKIS